MNAFIFHIFTKCGCEATLTHCYLDNGKTETGLVHGRLFYFHPHEGNKQGIPQWMSNKRPGMFYKSSKNHYVCVCVFLCLFLNEMQKKSNSWLNTMTELVHRGVPVISGWGSSCFCDRNEELAPPLLSPHLRDHLQLCDITFVTTFSRGAKMGENIN